MTKIDGTIADVHYTGCSFCKNLDIDFWVCKFKITDIEAAMRINGSSIICGLFKDEKEQEADDRQMPLFPGFCEDENEEEGA